MPTAAILALILLSALLAGVLVWRPAITLTLMENFWRPAAGREMDV